MAKTIGQLVTSQPAAAFSDTDLIELEQGAVSKGGTLLQMKQFLLPAGIMTEFAGSSIPTGWLLCDGSAVNRTTYANLFSAISTTWGIGDNSSTFNLPDMREACPQGAGTYSAVAGTTHGAITEHDARTLGAFADDQGQGHKHNSANSTPTGGSEVNVPFTISSSYAAGIYSYTIPTNVPMTDGANGTPRMGKVTRGKTIGVNYIIKY